MTKEVKIILADAQYITSIGLRYLLSQTANFAVKAVVGNKEELIEQIEDKNPDLIILDYDQPESFYLEDIPNIIEQYPNINILIISADQDEENIKQTIQYGIKGFLTKKCREDELRDAINAILGGRRFFCEKVLDVLMQAQKPNTEKNALDKLTDREREIVELVAEGLTSKQIAEKLFLSTHTVSTHRKNALGKLEVSSVPELVRFVIRENLKKN